MKDIKEASPIELAEYAVVNQIHDEPVFVWWVTYYLRKRDIIISKVKQNIERPHTNIEFNCQIILSKPCNLIERTEKRCGRQP